MTAAFEEVPFSELLHKPAATAGRLEQVKALRLHRRDANDLVLMSVDQRESENIVVDFTARLLAGLLHNQGTDDLRRALPEALPWVTFLPDSDVDQLIMELVVIVQGATALGNLAPVSTLLTQWRHTAEVYADPALLGILTREPDGDLGPVPKPPDSEKTAG